MDKVFLWPDGTWCYSDEIAQFSHKSDDYIVIYEDDPILEVVELFNPRPLAEI